MLHKTDVFGIGHSHSTSGTYFQFQNLSHHELDQPSVEHIDIGLTINNIIIYSLTLIKLKLIART